MKNETVNLGNNYISTADAEKYLVYDDGTPYVDIRGLSILFDGNTKCMYGPSAWNDAFCGSQKDIICEFDCDNVNDN